MLSTEDLDYGVEAFTQRLVNEAGEMVTDAMATYLKIGGDPGSEQDITDALIYQLDAIGRKFKEEVEKRLGDMAEDGIVSRNRN